MADSDFSSAKELPASSFRLKSLLLIDRRFRVPLDYSSILPGEITIFAREVVPAGTNDTRSQLPYLVYFQGGKYVPTTLCSSETACVRLSD